MTATSHLITTGSRVSDAGNYGGTVTAISANAIGRQVAHIERDNDLGGALQVVELLTWTGGAKADNETTTAVCVTASDGYHAHEHTFGDLLIEVHLHTWLEEHCAEHPDARPVTAWRAGRVTHPVYGVPVSMRCARSLGGFGDLSEALAALAPGVAAAPVECECPNAEATENGA